MSKYIYINSFSEDTPNNQNVGVVFLETVKDFECEFTTNPLQFQVIFNNNDFGRNWSVTIDNNIISDSDAKVLMDKAFSRTYVKALTDLNSVVDFFPPRGVSIGAQV